MCTGPLHLECSNVDASHSEALPGMTVRVQAPEVDSGRGDACFVLAAIMEQMKIFIA